MGTLAFNSLLKIGDSTGGTSTGWPSNENDPSTGSSSSFTVIAETKDFSGPGFSADDEEITYHEASGKRKRFIQGLIDFGEVSLDINLIPTDTTHDGNTGLLADLLDGTLQRDFVIVFADDPGDDTSTLWFTGHVKGFEPSNPVEGVMTASITIKCDGEKIVVPQ